MSVVKIAALSLTVLFLLVAVVRLFHRPLRLALRVVFNSALGLLALWILERTAPVTGLALGVKGRSAEEMAAWMDKNGVKTLDEIRGCARRNG